MSGCNHFLIAPSQFYLYYDLIGVLSGWILYSSFRARSVRILWALVPMLLVTFIPYAMLLHRYHQFVHQFPVLSDFSMTIEKPHWTFENGALHQNEAGDSEFTIHGADASLFLEHPVQNWGEFARLWINVDLSQESEVTLRIDDMDAPENYFARFQHEWTGIAGQNQFCIELGESFLSSGKDMLDLDHIFRCGFIIHNASSGQVFRVNSLVLKKEECY